MYLNKENLHYMIYLREVFYMYEDLALNLDYIDDLSLVKKAYKIANDLHAGQFRESGEEYIVHPSRVAKILAKMHGDKEVICAALLHDTLEDTNYTKDEIECEFGADVANLVDGVSKEGRDNFSSDIEREIYNSNKLVLSSLSDIRVMVIKLADRLHNMSTLEFKEASSIISNSDETMRFYVPVSSLLGMRDMRRRLEDFAFKFLNKEEYEKTLCIREEILNYSGVNIFKQGILNYLNYVGIDGKVYVKYDGVMESYYKIKNGIDKLFKIYVITDEDYRLPFKDTFVKTVSYDEFNFMENGIASSFPLGNINETFEKLGVGDALLSLNSDYCKSLLDGGLR